MVTTTTTTYNNNNNNNINNNNTVINEQANLPSLITTWGTLGYVVIIVNLSPLYTTLLFLVY